MNTYWVDITVKVMANTQEMASVIVQDSLQSFSLYADQIKLEGIEFLLSADEYADAMPYDHFHE